MPTADTPDLGALRGRVAEWCDRTSVTVRLIEQQPGILEIDLRRKIVMLDDVKWPIIHEAHWPEDWWEALKERWFPAWAKRCWPVRYRHLVKRETPAIVNLALPPRMKTVLIPSWHEESVYVPTYPD